MKKLILRCLFMAALALAATGVAAGATVVVNANSLWSTLVGGSGALGQPNSSDTILVTNGATLSVDVNNGQCAGIQLGDNTAGLGSGALVFGAGSQVTCAGAVTVGGIGGTGSLDFSAGGLLQVAGALSRSQPTRNVLRRNRDNRDSTPAGPQTVPAGLGPYNNLTLSNSGAKTITGVNVGGTLSWQGTATATGVPVYGASATLSYDGTASQTSGAEFTAAMQNLTVNNAAGVVLAGSGTVNGTLALNSGALTIGANTLTLNGAVTIGGGSLVGGASAGIVFGGSGAATTLPSVALNNLTVNRAGGLALNPSVTVNGTLTLTNGPVTGGGNLTLGNSAAIIMAAGSLDAAPNFGTSLNLTYAGSAGITTGPELPVSSSVLSALTVNNSGRGRHWARSATVQWHPHAHEQGRFQSGPTRSL